MLFEPSIEELIMAGIVEVAGIDENTGEFLYDLTGDFYGIAPEIYQNRMEEMQSQVMHFWKLGFLDLDDPESRNPVVTLSEKAFDEEEIALLPPELKEVFLEIKRLFER